MNFFSSAARHPIHNESISQEGLSADPVVRITPESEPYGPQGALGAEGEPGNPLALIAHPERALDAARRMEANCRNGLRFYSDFRRVRALDEVPIGDDPFEIMDESAYVSGADFDPAFSRRF